MNRNACVDGFATDEVFGFGSEKCKVSMIIYWAMFTSAILTGLLVFGFQVKQHTDQLSSRRKTRRIHIFLTIELFYNICAALYGLLVGLNIISARNSLGVVGFGVVFLVSGLSYFGVLMKFSQIRDKLAPIQYRMENPTTEKTKATRDYILLFLIVCFVICLFVQTFILIIPPLLEPGGMVLWITIGVAFQSFCIIFIQLALLRQSYHLAVSFKVVVNGHVAEAAEEMEWTSKRLRFRYLVWNIMVDAYVVFIIAIYIIQPSLVWFTVFILHIIRTATVFFGVYSLKPTVFGGGGNGPARNANQNPNNIVSENQQILSGGGSSFVNNSTAPSSLASYQVPIRPSKKSNLSLFGKGKKKKNPPARSMLSRIVSMNEVETQIPEST